MGIRSWLDSLMPDYSGVGEAMPEHIGREKIMDPLVNAGVSLATLPERAIGAANTYAETGQYNPKPIVEAATLPLGTGGAVGVWKTPGEAVLGSGIVRPKGILTPAPAGYHGTPHPEEFTQFKPSTQDLGTHMTVDPGVSWPHAKRYRDMEQDVARPKTIPVVADVESAFKFPHDPAGWHNPDRMLSILDQRARAGYGVPRGMITDFERIAKEGWEKNFIPAMQEKGFDSIVYPHQTYRGSGPPPFNSIMAFDPKKMVPRLSEEGQAIIERRGVHEPYKRMPWTTYEKIPEPTWKPPQGLVRPYDKLAKPDEAIPMIEGMMGRRWQAAADKQIAETDAFAQKHGVDLNHPKNKDKRWDQIFPVEALVRAEREGEVLITTGPNSSQWIDRAKFDSLKNQKRPKSLLDAIFGEEKT